MPSATDAAKLAGPCPNPECSVKMTRTSGMVTGPTQGLPRVNVGKQGCSRCLQTGTRKQKVPKFQWTPGTLAMAVDIGLKKLDGITIRRADSDFARVLAAEDAAKAAEEAKKVAA